jgi:hypothetical protein
MGSDGKLQRECGRFMADEAQSCKSSLKEVSEFLETVACVDTNRFRICQDAAQLEHAWQV